MKFKIGNEVYLREDSRWNDGDEINNPVGVVGTIDEINIEGYDYDYGVMWSNGRHNCCYKDCDLVLATEQTSTLSNFTQEDYDEMQDRIELLESLLVDANNRIAQLEAPKMVFNKPIEDYTMEDWQKAMEEHAVFETADGDTLTLIRISESIGDLHPIETSRSSYTIQGYYYVGNANPQYNIIRRIK